MTQESEAAAEAATREAQVRRLERLTEPVLQLLAIALVPSLLGLLVWDLDDDDITVSLIVAGAVWGVFAIDYGVKLALSAHPAAYLRHSRRHALTVVLPFLRPLVALWALAADPRGAPLRRAFDADSLFMAAAGLVLTSATVVFRFEQAGNATFATFPDTLWWAMVTITTVGYGDAVPVTVAGRLIAVVLMIGGVAFIAALAGQLAAFLVRSREVDTQADTPVDAKLNEQGRDQANVRILLQEVRELRAALASARDEGQGEREDRG